MFVNIFPSNQNHSVCRVDPILIFRLGSTSVVPAWCHGEAEGGSLFLKAVVFKEQVPKL